MRILINKFGDILTSRPAGRDAALAARAYLVPDVASEIVLDFVGVKVLTPSWADEFIHGLEEAQIGSISFEHTTNPSVRATLDILARQPLAAV